MSRDELLAAIEVVLAKLARSNPRPPAELVAGLIGMSRSALYDNLKFYGLRWPDVRRESLSKPKN